MIRPGQVSNRPRIRSRLNSGVASAIATRLANPQPTRCCGVETAISVPPPFLERVRPSLPEVRSGSGGAEALDKEHRDDRDADQDQDRHRRPDPEVEAGEKVVVV